MRITLSQARTLAAFDTLGGELTDVSDDERGPTLRVTFVPDAAERTGIEYVDVTFAGVAYVTLLDGGWYHMTRGEARAMLRNHFNPEA